MNIDLDKYNKTCYIVGGGRSLKDFDWELFDVPDKFVVAINAAHLVIPNCDLIYLTDAPYIHSNIKTLTEHSAPVWQGVLNLTDPPKLDVVDKQIQLMSASGLIQNKNPYEVAHGSNSTYAFINLAVNIGFNRIYLFGIDMKFGATNDKKTSHWHSESKPHERVDEERDYQRMLNCFKSIKQPLIDHGVEVFNVNTPETTALREFTIISKTEVFL